MNEDYKIDDVFYKIVDLLKEVERFENKDGKRLVYEYDRAEPEGYPYASVVYMNSEEDILSQSKNEVAHFYTVRVTLSKIDDIGRKRSDEVLRRVVDEVSKKFRETKNLGLDYVSQIRPVQVETGTVDNGTRSIIDFEVEVRVQERVKYC